MKFHHHPKFLDELDKFIGKSCSGNASVELTLKYIEKLIEGYLVDPSSISPKLIGRAQGFGGHYVYWFKIMIPNGGLRKTQNPKSYFYHNDDLMSFLCLDSHIQNYKDSKLRKVAQNRLDDIIQSLNIV